MIPTINFHGDYWTRQTYYAWLDDTGEIIRWALVKPADGQAYLMRKPVPINTETCGEALL